VIQIFLIWPYAGTGKIHAIAILVKRERLMKIKCLLCGDIIKSYHVHDFKHCQCGACFIDGGDEYLRCGGNPSDMEFIEEEADKKEDE
jgi:hypothetical protein